MAKVNISFDTVSKQLSCTLDGEEVQNLSGVYFSKRFSYTDTDEDDAPPLFMMQISTYEEDEDNGLRKTYLVSANEKGEMVKANEEDTPSIELQNEINKYLGR